MVANTNLYWGSSRIFIGDILHSKGKTGMVLKLLLSGFITFWVMEFVAWFAHKYVMHGTLWILHEDHHVPPKHKSNSFFEKNDWFFVIFWVFLNWVCFVKKRDKVAEEQRHKEEYRMLNFQNRFFYVKERVMFDMYYTRFWPKIKVFCSYFGRTEGESVKRKTQNCGLSSFDFTRGNDGRK